MLLLWLSLAVVAAALVACHLWVAAAVVAAVVDN